MSIIRAFNLQGSMIKQGPADGKAGILIGGSYTSIEMLAWKIEIKFRDINETVCQPSG